MSTIADLTYFIGRPFVALEVDDENEGEWTIVLDGNGRITNKNPTQEMPDVDKLKGSTFIRPIFSELDTRLQFGVLDTVNAEVTLSPTKYTMSDPNLETEEEYYPQVPVELADTLPPDPSDERVADGPDEQPEGESENAA